MSGSNDESELRTALTAFETSVATPVVSGELGDWADTVRKAWSEASAQIDRQIRELHPRQYEEISNADAALFQQIELLKAEDSAIEQDRDRLDRAVKRVADHVPKLEPDEAKAEPHVESLVEDAMAFVGRVRKQEVAVQTWFMEAFNRERGGGD